MKTLVIFFLASFLAFGQEKPTPLTPEQSAQAWAQVEPMIKSAGRDTAARIPAINGGALVTERQLNEYGQRVVLTYSLQGVYLLQGVTCGGAPVDLGGFDHQGQGNFFVPSLVLDTNRRFESAPHAPDICFVNAFRLQGGSVEQLGVTLRGATVPPPQVRAESLDRNGYQMTLYGVSVEATIAVGNQAISLRKELLPDGSIRVFFPAGSYLPPPGPATLTVCQGGKCQTGVFNRYLEVPIPKG